jgi:hypothetical protein
MRQQCQELTRRSIGGGNAVRSISTEHGQSATRVCCVVVEVVAASASNGCVQNYCDTLQNLRRAIKHKRPEKLSRGVLMLHDNAHPHAAHATWDTLRRFGWSVLDHPAYSPDISPCDSHVFGPLKKTMKGRKFNSDGAVLEAVVQWFIQKPLPFFAESITKLVQCWDKCLNSCGQYLYPVSYCHPCVVTVV